MKTAFTRCAIVTVALAAMHCGPSTTQPSDARGGDATSADAQGSDAIATDGSTTDARGLDAAVTETGTNDVTVPTDVVSADRVSADVVTVDENRSDVRIAADVVSTDVASADVVSADGPACSGAMPTCVSGTPGGACGDVVMAAVCTEGTWRCPTGTIDASLCGGCIGRPPGSTCTCVRGAWVCDDAGAPDTGSLACTGRPSSCTTGTAGGQCSDALTAPTCVDGTWRCGPGEVFVTQCACIGIPPGRGCVCTPMGWSCGGADAGADASPDAARTFACGPRASCLSGTQYCQAVVGGAAGAEPSYSCRDLPSTCTMRPSCACLAIPGGAGRCSQSDAGDLTVQIFAP